MGTHTHTHTHTHTNIHTYIHTCIRCASVNVWNERYTDGMGSGIRAPEHDCNRNPRKTKPEIVFTN